ncbi:hypothetical protein IAQ61_005365 [Plenodomus lingam]|uniref:uncharacterized protein n=1 Tax=Leptosphaeria maculans TaxID=5022 RepID=UPI00331BB8ED|nr:hypothetical protein IAQ61_005365 [Plenodomus lingam]
MQQAHTMADSQSETLFSQSEKSSQRSSSRSYKSLPSLRLYKRQILLTSLLVVLPMTVFTIVILALVFSTTVRNLSCHHEAICPAPPLINITSSSYYYVDYPATRLVFISSWSSTISFALVSAIMVMFAYRGAAQLMAASSSANPDNNLPSPYQMSLLMRILNVDYLSLWTYARDGMRHKTRRKQTPGSLERAKILSSAAIVLVLSLITSVLIQAADSYLHISTVSVEMTQIFPDPPNALQNSRRMGEWCLDSRPTFGTPENINFWGCSSYVDPEVQFFVKRNLSTFWQWKSIPAKDYLLNYTDENKSQYAILGPLKTPSNIDYTASSFAVSASCQPVPALACDIAVDVPMSLTRQGISFHCLKSRGSPIDFQGNISHSVAATNAINFHKYMMENEAFMSDEINMKTNTLEEIAPTVTDEEAKAMWSNPWQWVGQLDVIGRVRDFPDLPNKTTWRTDWWDKMVLHCNSTVYDVNYTLVGGVVTGMNKTVSNSTVAGNAIFPSLYTSGYYNDVLKAIPPLTFSATTWDEFKTIYEIESSRLVVMALAPNTVAETSPLSQRRSNRIISQISAAALWSLVLANMAFALLATGVAIMAWRASSDEVYQVQARFGIPGLAAALFDQEASKQCISSARELFRENTHGPAPEVAVGVRRTQTEGMTWTLRTVGSQEFQDVERPCSNMGDVAVQDAKGIDERGNMKTTTHEPLLSQLPSGSSTVICNDDRGLGTDFERLDVDIGPANLWFEDRQGSFGGER